MARAKTDVPTLVLLGVMYAVLLGNVALWVLARQHPVVHVLVGALGIHMAFTIWHEAAHGTIFGSTRGNDVIGIVGMFPYMTPYFMQKWVHLEHHRRLNLEDDPNFVYTGGPFLGIFLRYPRVLGYAKKILKVDPRSPGERLSDLTTTLLVVGAYGAAIALGQGVAVLVLWFLPVVVGKIVMDWYVNWLPHVGLPPDRFRGTRVLDVPWFTPLVLGHNYHAIHHLWPPVPWHRYLQVYRRKRAYLEQHGVPIEQSFRAFSRTPLPPGYDRGADPTGPDEAEDTP